MSGSEPLPPGSTIGILGGGQLGRMLALAAARLGLRCLIFCPDPESPAFDVAAGHVVAGYDDIAALKAFAGRCDVVTFEFENVPAPALETLTGRVRTRPAERSLAVCQDRMEEKTLVERIGVRTAPWRQADTYDELTAAIAAIGTPAVLKTRRFGYDGKGQARISATADCEAAWRAVAGAPSIVESLIPFALEISVVAVRGPDGDFIAYDVAENLHDHGILRISRVPAGVTPGTAATAVEIARKIAHELDHVGVLAVEMFVIRADGGEELLVNEIAPRVHNTGHWTIEACPVSQFEAHIRAVAGWPVPSTKRLADAEMVNLIGDDVDRWRELSAEPGTALHLYGKRETRAGRKMGHATHLKPHGT